MKALIRTFNPWVSGKGGQPLEKPRWSGEYWSQFEKLLIDELKLRYDVHQQPENVNKEDELPEVDLALYAHRNFYDIDNKTVYSYPKYADAKKRLFYMMMHLPGWFQLDIKGWGAQHSSYEAPPDLSNVDEAAAVSFSDNLLDKIVNGNISKIGQPAQADIDSHGYLLMLTQLENDYTIKYQSKLKIPEFINGIAKWAKQNNVKVIVKRHPLDQSTDVGASVNACKHAGFVETKANLHSLIKSARAVYVINSGTGFESLIHNKPVITFGKCDYKNATFAGNLTNLKEAWDWVNSFDNTRSKFLKKFIYWFYHNNIYDINDPNCQAKIKAKLESV